MKFRKDKLNYMVYGYILKWYKKGKDAVSLKVRRLTIPTGKEAVYDWEGSWGASNVLYNLPFYIYMCVNFIKKF